MNVVVLKGNFTRDVELRYLPSGTAVGEVGIAVNNRRKKGEEWVDEPCFVDLVLWGRTAEIANEYLKKGSPALVEGRLEYDAWETDEGQKRSKLRVVVNKLDLLSKQTTTETTAEKTEELEPVATGGEDLDF